MLLRVGELVREMSDDMLRIRNRAARLVRLVDLEAPEVIIQREAQLVAQAADKLDPKGWAQLQAERAEVLRRRDKGLCEFCDAAEIVRAADRDGMCTPCRLEADELADDPAVS